MARYSRRSYGGGKAVAAYKLKSRVSYLSRKLYKLKKSKRALAFKTRLSDPAYRAKAAQRELIKISKRFKVTGDYLKEVIDLTVDNPVIPAGIPFANVKKE